MSDFLHSTDRWLPGLVAMLALMGISGFLSASETALFFLSHEEIRGFRLGRARERAAAALLSDPDRVLTGILFWNFVVNLLYFAIAIVVSQRLLSAHLHTAAGVFGFVALVSPASDAAKWCRKSWPPSGGDRWRPSWHCRSSGWCALLDPVLPLFRALTLVARRTFLPHIHQEPFLSTEDLEDAVNVSDLSAEMIRQEKQILHNILDLSEIRVEEVMRPRGSYAALPAPIRAADLGESFLRAIMWQFCSREATTSRRRLLCRVSH